MWRMQLEESMQSPPFELIDIVVRAGAGAGKTTELTARVIRLAEDYFLKHKRYPHFVVTTFTRKATQELKERLLKEAMKKADPGLTDFVKRPSQLHISTIHGVLSLYLSRYGSIMGLSPRISMISDSREKFQIKRKIRELCQSNDSFNENFRSLIESAEFSDVLESFCQYLKLKLQFGEVPYFSEQDFTAVLKEKSQSLEGKVRELVNQLKRNEIPEAWQELSTYCESSLKGLEKAPSVQQFWEKLADGLPSPRKTKTLPDGLAEARDEVKKELEFFLNWRATSDFCKAHGDLCEKFFSCADLISNEILEMKLLGGEITMQDLETLSLMLIRKHPETAEAFSKQWDYWLVDEYQDTSPAQVELLKSLSGRSKSFVVGDPQQSIYLFRGARSEVFSEREKIVQESKGVLFSKLTNYRSRPELLEFFNFLFTCLGSQFQKMKPKAEPESHPQSPVAQVLQAIGPEESTQDPEFEAVIFRCQEFLKAGVPLEKICVLSRSNKDLEEIAWLAQKYGLPVQVHSAGKFFERREVVDALSLLKFLCNPHDNKNLLQVLRSPVFRVTDQSLYEWCQETGSSFWASFSKRPHPVIRKLQSFLLQAQDSGVGPTWRDLLVMEGYFKFAHTMDPTGKREANLWKLIYLVQSEERRPGFSYLDFLKSLDVRSLSTEETDEADAVPVIEPKKVHMMTVHASKGLQFNHIILPKMGKTSPSPSADFFLSDERTGQWTLSLVDPEEGKKVCSLSGLSLLETLKRRQKEEEDRVLYVALTRAEESVTLIWGEEPKKESWAERLPLHKDEGQYSEKNFCYLVRKGHFVPETLTGFGQDDRPEIKAYDLGLQLEVETFSVTEILDKKQIQENKNSKTEMSDIQKAITGVDVHRMLENLKYNWMKNPQFQWEEMLGLLSAQHQKALQYVARDQSGLWLEVIQQGEVEFGMAVKLEDKLIQGQIDLWGFDSKGAAWVVDYKTGNPKYQDKAFHQLHIYSWALQKMKKIKPTQTVNLAVIYPFSEQTLIRQSPSMAEIESELKSLRS